MAKKKKKHKDRDLTKRIRGYVLDSQINAPHEIAELLGCSQISEEVKEKEEQESDKRVDRIAYLVPTLHSHAHVIAEGAVEYQRINTASSEHNIPEDIWEKSREMMEHISMSALLGSVSQLVDMGLLKLPKEYK